MLDRLLEEDGVTGDQYGPYDPAFVESERERVRQDKVCTGLPPWVAACAMQSCIYGGAHHRDFCGVCTLRTAVGFSLACRC